MPAETVTGLMWAERPFATYVLNPAAGRRCVAFARRRPSDLVWEVKRCGVGRTVHEFGDREAAHVKLRELVGLPPGGGS
jgi:hypothetical protein